MSESVTSQNSMSTEKGTRLELGQQCLNVTMSDKPRTDTAETPAVEISTLDLVS